MKKVLLAVSLLSIFFASCVKDRVTSTVVVPPVVNTSGDSLLVYWNCNTDTSHIRTPTFARTSGATFSYGGAYFDTVQPGTNLNGQGADTGNIAGNGSLRLRNPANEGAFTLTLPTTGYKNIVLKYAMERTSKGAQTNTVAYTTDGTNYKNTAIGSQPYIYNVDTVFHVVSFDFSSDPAVNDNANFKVQITFTNGNTNTSGNDRMDNITLSGEKK